MTGIYDFRVADIDGNDVNLADYKGRVLLVVNVASKCGFTPQYKGLQKLYDQYKDKGFVILAFPSNDFMGQEPGTNEQIKTFCQLNYQVSFPLFSKISVKGRDIHPLYKFLTENSTDPNFAGGITWNFNKFLIDRKAISSTGSALKRNRRIRKSSRPSRMRCGDIYSVDDKTKPSKSCLRLWIVTAYASASANSSESA